MGNSKGSTDDTEKLIKQAISAFVSVTHVIAFFQIVICSRHMAVAFDIPAKNIGIYFAKLYSLRSLLMSAGCGIEYGIYRTIQSTKSDMAKDIRKYFSMAWFVLLTISEVSFLCVLYLSKSVAFHNYIVLNLEGMFFGFFQMSILSLIPEFAAYYMLSLYVSGTSIFIIQTIIDKCTKNSMLSVKIQSWICVLCSVICVGLWPVRLFVLKDQDSNNSGGGSQTCGSNSGTASAVSGSGAGNGTPNGAGGGGSGSSSPSSEPDWSSMSYVMSLTSITILKILTDKLDSLCSQLRSDAIANVQILIGRLKQIRLEREITYDVLVAIDLVILGLKKCICQSDQLCLLTELSLFLRMKVLIKPLGLEKQEQEVEIQQMSYLSTRLGVEDRGNGGTGEPVVAIAGRYRQLIKYVKSPSLKRKRREASGAQRPRVRRSTEQQTTHSKSFPEHLLYSLSQLMMFPIGSLVKDFLFPGVIPYGLLERDKCHLINLIVIIFLSVGPITVFVLNQAIEEFKKNNTWIHLFWSCMIPKILILIISLCSIHTKKGCTHKIRSSQGIVLFMTVVLLTCYGFLETMSFVGMAFYVKVISCDPSGTVDLQAIHNVFGKFFRYFVYKLSVGYNKTRISAGFVLPNFKPPEPIPDTFCYWFKGSFSNGWKDIKGDFKMGITQYLAATQTLSKKSPLESLRYCDLLM